MTKPGDSYQELVAAVQAALEPGARVEVGEWIEGPDGERDMDVSVYGRSEAADLFVLIECKDHSRPVGIGYVDAFDSKRRDLRADRALMFSNSGFTAQAEAKAQRVGIGLVCALREGDPHVRMRVQRDLVAKVLSVDKWTAVLYWGRDRQYSLPSDWDFTALVFEGSKVINWLAVQSRRLLTEHEGAALVVANYAFGREYEFRLGADTLWLIGIGARLQCAQRWVGQIVREDVTLGAYDILRGRLLTPDQQSWIVGPIDNTAWTPRDGPMHSQPLEPGTIDFGLVLMNPIPGEDDLPNLDSIIAEREERPLE